MRPLFAWVGNITEDLDTSGTARALCGWLHHATAGSATDRSPGRSVISVREVTAAHVEHHAGWRNETRKEIHLMIGIKQAQGGIAEAVAAARDEALVEIGREAAVRQGIRQAKAHRGRTGALVTAAVAAGAALAAGAVVYRARTRRNEKDGPATNGHPPAVNGMVSEHEHHEEYEDEPVMSKR